jgi:hypothetical protein
MVSRGMGCSSTLGLQTQQMGIQRWHNRMCVYICMYIWSYISKQFIYMKIKLPPDLLKRNIFAAAKVWMLVCHLPRWHTTEKFQSFREAKKMMHRVVE